MALSKEQCAEIVKLYYKHNSPQTVIRLMRKSYQELLLKVDMKSYIPLETAAIFFLRTFFLNRVLARSMSRLISFAWAYSGCKEGKPRITKWKILAHTGTRTHDPWFSSLVPYPWGYPVWYINVNSNFSSRIQVCIVLFIATSYHARESFHFVMYSVM